MVPGFPNFFMLMGPNTGLAHGGNVIFITECQMRLILTALREVLETGAHAIDVKPEAHDAYVADVDERHAKRLARRDCLAHLALEHMIECAAIGQAG